MSGHRAQRFRAGRGPSPTGEKPANSSYRGVDQLADRLAHNQEGAGSSPAPATNPAGTDEPDPAVRRAPASAAAGARPHDDSDPDGRDAADRTIPASRSPLKRPLRTRAAIAEQLIRHARAVLASGPRTHHFAHLKVMSDEIEAHGWPEALMLVQAARLTVEADPAARGDWRVIAHALFELVERTAGLVHDGDRHVGCDP